MALGDPMGTQQQFDSFNKTPWLSDPVGSGTPSGGSLDDMASGRFDEFKDTRGSGDRGGGVFGESTGGIVGAAGVGLAGAGAAFSLLGGHRDSFEKHQLQSGAYNLGQQGQMLMGYLQSGTLPPGLQAGIDNASAAMRARIIANHAKTGNPTDPSQNSALAQELNNVELQSKALVAQEGEKLMKMGLDEVGMSENMYLQLEKMNREDQASIGKAIAGFAQAAARFAPLMLL